jgi:hypothetical protein
MTFKVSLQELNTSTYFMIISMYLYVSALLITITISKIKLIFTNNNKTEYIPLNFE